MAVIKAPTPDLYCPRAAFNPAMAQFGSQTVIGPEVRLLILDCFETLVAFHGEGYRPRTGMMAFLRHYRNKGLKLVVHSDADLDRVNAALAEASLTEFFPAIYHRGNATDRFEDGLVRKRLDKVLEMERMEPSQVMFIGDSPLDARSAEEFAVPFMRVPRSEDASFSFARLIGGASRYSSGEFSMAMLEHYLKGGKS